MAPTPCEFGLMREAKTGTKNHREVIMAKKTSNSKLKAVAKYDAKTAKYFGVKFNIKTDADIIEKLDSIGSVQTYIKKLIREDIERSYRVFRKNEDSILGIFDTADDAIHFVGDYSLENGEDLNPAECNFEIIGPDGKIEW